MKRKLTAVVAAIIVLAGCSPIESGVIEAKVAEPGEWKYVTLCTPVGRVTVCRPSPYYDDPDWRFDLSNLDATGWVYVNEEIFNEYAVGDLYEPR